MQYGDLMSKALISRLTRTDRNQTPKTDEIWALAPGNGKISGGLRRVEYRSRDGKLTKSYTRPHGVNEGITLKAAERKAASDPHYFWRVWSAGQCYERKGTKDWRKTNA